MADAPTVQPGLPHQHDTLSVAEAGLHGSSTSLRELWVVLVRRRLLIASIEGGLLLVCLLYCLIAPNQYEARARVELRTAPVSSLNLDSSEPAVSASILSAPVAQETMADVFRSDRLAWRVIRELKLYEAPGFRGDFARRFPGFHLATEENGAVDPAAQAWLLERFGKRLRVQTLPRTLLIEIRFRSRDAALSAAVVNALIGAYGEQDSESRVEATEQASDWLNTQLKELKAKVDQDHDRLNAFESKHGIVSVPALFANGNSSETAHSATLLEIDELGRQLVAATTDRILREAEFQAASKGDPELVVASDPTLQSGGFATAPLQQIRGRRGDLEQERAQLSAEHGPNFPRVVEIGRQLQDLDRQKQAEDAKVVARFRSAWQTATDREQLVRKSLDEHTAEGMKLNQAAIEYAVMRQEANANHELYMRVKEKVDEAGLSSGIHSPTISVVDYARPPVKPVAPDLPLYMAITLFVGLWVAVGGALLLESFGASDARVLVVLLALALAGGAARGQAPTPSTSGLPTGVAHIPQTVETPEQPNPKDAPPVWNNLGGTGQAGAIQTGASLAGVPMPAAIGSGDLLEISEYRTPEFHSVARVSATGTVTLPMIGEVQLGGLDEKAAAGAIEAALVAKGMLLHPQVSVLVILYAGQDVSVLGEVVRPGVYPYTVHHRLLDAISQASGVAPGAG